MKIFFIFVFLIFAIMMVLATNLVVISRKLYACNSTIKMENKLYSDQKVFCKDYYVFLSSLNNCYLNARNTTILIPNDISSKLYAKIFKSNFNTIEENKSIQNQLCGDYPKLLFKD